MYYVLRIVSAFLAFLSVGKIDLLAKFLTFLCYDVLAVRKSLILANLQRAFGKELSPGALRSIGHTSSYNFFLTVFEFLRASKIDLAGKIEFRGRENIERALDKGKGVFILCTHTGNWEAMGAAVTRFVAPAHVIVKTVGSPQVNRFVNEIRAQNGFLVLKRKKNSNVLLTIKRILKRGEAIGFVIDQARPGEPRIDFFGHPAKTNTTLAAMYRITRSEVVPGFIRREGIGRHTVEFLPALDLEVTDDRDGDVLRLTKQFNAVAEDMIRKNPEQYLWMHNRWK